MYEIRNDIDIDGPADQVWEVLTDFDRYTQWNPVIRHVAGTLTVGTNIVISVAAPTGLLDWTCGVTRVEPGREFAWTFHEHHPLLYRGEHAFRIEPIGTHKTRYLDPETFNGLLVPRRKRHLSTNTKAGMDAMGAALKDRVETSANRPDQDVGHRPVDPPPADSRGSRGSYTTVAL